MRISFVLVAGVLLLETSALSDDSSEEIIARRNRAIEQCQNNPVDPKCEKLLDAQYRRLKDSEKEYKEDKEERYFEQKMKKQSLSEIRAFCRTTPNSERCNQLKSRSAQ